MRSRAGKWGQTPISEIGDRPQFLGKANPRVRIAQLDQSVDLEMSITDASREFGDSPGNPRCCRFLARRTQDFRKANKFNGLLQVLGNILLPAIHALFPYILR